MQPYRKDTVLQVSRLTGEEHEVSFFRRTIRARYRRQTEFGRMMDAWK